MKKTNRQPATSHVKATRKLAVATVTKRYQSVYFKDIVFDDEVLQLGCNSWVWLLLKDMADETSLVRLPGQSIEQLHRLLGLLVKDPGCHKIMAQSPQQTNSTDIRHLFQRSEEVVINKDSATLGRARSTFRSMVYARAHSIPFGEDVNPHRVGFRPKIPYPRSEPRALISDHSDISDVIAKTPIGALRTNSASELVEKIRSRTQYDLQRIREACICDMVAAAELRVRAKTLRKMKLSDSDVALIRDSMRNKSYISLDLRTRELSTNEILVGVLKVIHEDRLAMASASSDSYCIPISDAVKREFQAKIAPEFKSQRLIEIEYRACVEELFAAFHLIHTYVGWNWSSIMTMQVDQIDLKTPGIVLLQSYKSKTDDDTPLISVSLDEPGVRMAVDIILWNWQQLVKSGFFDSKNLLLWKTRPRPGISQEPGSFHPTQRLSDFRLRHRLTNYSFDQVRSQVLFNLSLTKGGIEAARLRGGHRNYGATERYVGNILQDRISSALNLEFSKRLEKEVLYLYEGGSHNGSDISLLRPLGDGASCINPDEPPIDRRSQHGSCKAEECHSRNGCRNRLILIDSARVEEVVRLNLHYQNQWQRLWQDNPERFVEHILPSLAFNAALLLTLERGPYAAQVMQIQKMIGMK